MSHIQTEMKTSEELNLAPTPVIYNTLKFRDIISQPITNVRTKKINETINSSKNDTYV